MKTNAGTLGRVGEKLTEWHLTSSGYEIVARRFRVPGGEIDLVARKEHRLIFIEVKTRSHLRFGAGIESISRAKAKALRRAMHEFICRESTLTANLGEVASTQIDVIDILLDLKKGKILSLTHYKNVHLGARAYYSRGRYGANSE